MVSNKHRWLSAPALGAHRILLSPQPPRNKVWYAISNTCCSPVGMSSHQRPQMMVNFITARNANCLQYYFPQFGEGKKKDYEIILLSVCLCIFLNFVFSVWSV
jgi:hypothetical protein